MVKLETAMFAMGCFWSPQVLFDKLNGVKKTQVGYSGGKIKNPSYEQVCSGETGHAEVIKIWFDPKIISYKKLLDIFWSNHNPTTLNKQGPDVGDQYRSAIFYYNKKQKKEIIETKDKIQKKWDNPIVTEIGKAKAFYKAEDYHQKYLEKRGLQTCHV